MPCKISASTDASVSIIFPLSHKLSAPMSDRVTTAKRAKLSYQHRTRAMVSIAVVVKRLISLTAIVKSIVTKFHPHFFTVSIANL